MRAGIGTFAFVWPAQATLGLPTANTIWAMPYSALFGFTLLVLALRLRQLAQEIPARPARRCFSNAS